MLIMITFLCICGYWTWFWTHECILTIFRQVIFVDICGYLCVNSFETCGSALVICAVLLMFFLTFICRYCSTFGEVLSE